MKKKKMKMTFEVVEDLNFVIDEETLKKEYKGDIHKLAKQLYRSDGFWWRTPIKLVKTEIIS